VFDDVDHAASLFNLHNFGYIYSRLTNPTVSVLEERIASLEGGRAAVAAASGHAAQFLIFFTLLEPGDEFLASRNLYGGSLTQFGLSFKKLGWTCHFVDPTDPGEFPPALTPKTKAIFVESLANPGGVCRRPRGGRGCRARCRHSADRRQHAGDALSVPAVRVGRRHRLPFDDEVPRRPRQLAGRRGRRVRQIRLGAGRPKFPSLTEPEPAYHGLRFYENFRRFRVHHQGAGGGAARLRPGHGADERVPDHHRHRDLHVRMERHVANAQKVAEFLAGTRASPGCPMPGWRTARIGAGAQIPAEGRRRGVHLRRQGRLRGRGQAGRERAAVLAPRQYRRHPQPDPAPGVDHAPPADRRAARWPPAPGPM
jgi:O-acetylhomoserine (thiol)-lyase